MSLFVFLVVLVAAAEDVVDTTCKVRISLNGDSSKIDYTEGSPALIDHTIHQWCAAHDIHDANTCNQLRNHFLEVCFPDYFYDFRGPIYTIVYNDNTYNLQMRASDKHMNTTIDRFCILYTPSLDPFSPECMHMKSVFMNDDSFIAPLLESNEPNTSLLEYLFHKALTESSDVQEHMSDHALLASECAVVMEVGVRGMVSTWGILWGLHHSRHSPKKYIGVDLNYPTGVTWRQFERSCADSEVECVFLAQNDLTLSPESLGPVDMLFLDALHTYCHVLYELITFHTTVRRYITLHDTSAPWGEVDEEYSGDHSEYPPFVAAQCSSEKKGVFTAVMDFLAQHPLEWALRLKKESSNGYTVLERVREPQQ